MKNGLNLFIMSVDDVIQWYKPQTEEESYLVDLLSKTSSKPAKELQDEVDDLEDENDKLEDDNTNLIKENHLLKQANDSLEERVSDLENQILEELDN